MVREPIEIQSRVIVARNFIEDVMQRPDWLSGRAELHVSIDPVTGLRIAHLFTDDGAGNGDCILTIELEQSRDPKIGNYILDSRDTFG